MSEIDTSFKIEIPKFIFFDHEIINNIDNHYHDAIFIAYSINGCGGDCCGGDCCGGDCCGGDCCGGDCCGGDCCGGEVD